MGKIVERLKVSGLLQSGFAFFVAVGAVSLSSFIFHVIFSRLLGPSSYGALGSLLNLLLLMTVPMSALGTLVTRSESSHRTVGGPGIGVRSAVLRATVVGTTAMIALIAISPLVSGFLHFTSIWPVVVLSSWLIPATIGSVLQGILLGRLQFAAPSLAAIVGQVFGRLVIGLLLFEVGLGFEAAVVASAASQFIYTGILFRPLLPEFVHKKTLELGIDIKSGLLPLLALIGYWILCTEDTILARHFLFAQSAGLYAGASTAGGIALFLPGPIAVIVFPRFARYQGRGELAWMILRRSLGVTLLLGLMCATVLAIAPSLVLLVLFGQGYLQAADAVRILGFESAGLSVIGLFIYFNLARASLNSLYGWVGASLGFFSLEVFHRTRSQIALGMLGAVSITMVLLIISALGASIRDSRDKDKKHSLNL